MNVDYSNDFKKSVKKLSGKMLDSVRRVVEEVKDTIIFRYLVPRGEAYDKKAQKELKRIDDCIHYKIILLSILPNHPYHQPLHTQSILMLLCRLFWA